MQLEEPDDRLSPGMTGELAFVMDAKDKAMVVPSQALQGGAIYIGATRRARARRS